MPTLEDALPGYSLFNFVPPRPRTNVNGNPDEWEVMELAKIARFVMAQTAFEFGTFNGCTALVLSETVSGRVFTLDLANGMRPKLPRCA